MRICYEKNSRTTFSMATAVLLILYKAYTVKFFYIIQLVLSELICVEVLFFIFLLQTKMEDS